MQDFLNRFYHNLPSYPYSTSNFSRGLSTYHKSYCKEEDYIQFNKWNSINYIVLDLDYEESVCEIVYSKIGLPLPNLIIENIKNGRSHIVFELKKGIHNNPDSRIKPILFLKAVISKLTDIYKADTQYSGLICKNPFSQKWRLTQIRKEAYSLTELADKLDLNNSETKQSSNTQSEYAE